MKRGEGFSIAAVAIALMLSVFLAFISNASGLKLVISIGGLIRQSVTVQPAACQSSFTDATAANGSPSY